MKGRSRSRIQYPEVNQHVSRLALFICMIPHGSVLRCECLGYGEDDPCGRTSIFLINKLFKIKNTHLLLGKRVFITDPMWKIFTWDISTSIRDLVHSYWPSWRWKISYILPKLKCMTIPIFTWRLIHHNTSNMHI